MPAISGVGLEARQVPFEIYSGHINASKCTTGVPGIPVALDHATSKFSVYRAQGYDGTCSGDEIGLVGIILLVRTIPSFGQLIEDFPLRNYLLSSGIIVCLPS